jgi:two-component system response regulator HydG
VRSSSTSAEKTQREREFQYEEIAPSGAARSILLDISPVVRIAPRHGMVQLVHDRFMRLEGDRACDLATGAEVRLDALTEAVPAETEASFGPLLEALDHGRDGYPRWVVADARSRRQATSTIERVATAAVRRGFVTISTDLYLRFRELLGAELRERTLLLAGSFGANRSRAHAALLDASARSARPHLLITFEYAAAHSGPALVREARATYALRHGSVAPPESPEVTQLIARASRADAFAAEGRHAAAERLLRDVTGALARRRAFQPAARLTITLARLLNERGRPEAAFAALGEAARLAQSGQDDELVVEARLGQAVTRIANAAFVEAESICRAALAADALSGRLQIWARAVLAEALLWQGRIDDLPDLSSTCEPSGLDAPVAAAVYEVEIRVLLAKGRVFDAGRRVELSKKLAEQSADPLVALIAHIADLTVLGTAGDLARAQDALQRAVAASRAARAPLRAAWARLTWIDALRRGGRGDEADRDLARLRCFGRVAPLLLRREIARRSVAEAGSPARNPFAVIPRQSSLSVALVRIAQDDQDDREAIGRLIERLSVELQTSRIDLLSADAGPVTTVCSVGDGLMTTVGTRVLEAAFAIGPERHKGGWESGVPVRFGSRTSGAIVCRWPVDRTMPGDASELLELTAAIVAPRLDTLLTVTRDESKASMAVPELIGVSDAIAEVRKAIVRAAAAPFTVLIEGESGVGKELAARAVHHLSARRERRFCDVNCAALPEELLESELFGHTRGAFSGAVADRAGLFEEADGGTLFLDEVADLSSRAQAKLLRAIQQQEVRRLGESFSRKVDTRLVAAANRDMRAEAAAGRFRQDLLYRLDVVRIRIPPLRERPDDIPVLAAHCWRLASARVGSRADLSTAVLAELARYQWPGNVRELQNVIASLAVAAPARGRVRASLLPPVISAATIVSSGRLAEAREQFERRFIEVALARAGGNRSRAARGLGLSRQGLLKTMVRLGIAESSNNL